MSPQKITMVYKTHTCRQMEYNRCSGTTIEGHSRTGTAPEAFCGGWRLLRENANNFPQNIYIDYCPFCGEWLEADSRTAPPEKK